VRSIWWPTDRRCRSIRGTYPAAPAHLEALSNTLGSAATFMRDAIDQASSLGDEVTADILVGATRAIDKLHGMVRAHRSVEAVATAEHAPRERKPEATAH
jgi:DNA-binding ferritin-like protein